jgi:hypothetical protein
MVVVRVDQHHLVAQCWIGAADHSDDVHGVCSVGRRDAISRRERRQQRQLPDAVPRRERDRDALEKPAVSSWLDAVARELCGNELRGAGRSWCRGAPPLHRVIRDGAEEPAHVGIGDATGSRCGLSRWRRRRWRSRRNDGRSRTCHERGKAKRRSEQREARERAHRDRLGRWVSGAALRAAER